MSAATSAKETELALAAAWLVPLEPFPASRKRGSWQAVITEKGAAYLEHGPSFAPPDIQTPPVEHGHDHLGTETYAGQDYLVVGTDNGGSAHLVAPLVNGTRGRRRRARTAVPTYGLNVEEYARHDLDLLSKACWNDVTVCDRRWSSMLSDAQRQRLEGYDFDTFHFSPRAPRELPRDIRCSRCWSRVRQATL